MTEMINIPVSKPLLEKSLQKTINDCRDNIKKTTTFMVESFYDTVSEKGLEEALEELSQNLHKLVDHSISKGLNLEGITVPKEDQQ